MGSKSKKKPQVLTRAKEEAIKHDAISHIMIVFVATCVEEFGWQDADIKLFVERFKRYSNAVDEKLITLRHVQELVNEEAGTDLHFY